MVLAHHLVFGAYGFWLPNDPRGSWSKYVGSRPIYYAGGPATNTAERRSLAHDPHDRELRRSTKNQLSRPPVRLNEEQRQIVGDAFGGYVRRSGLVVLACAVMPDHFHLVYEEFRISYEQVAIQLRAAATREFVKLKKHPFQNEILDDERPPKCFARGEWSVWLESNDDIARAIDYVERNPLEIGLPAQQWDFVRRAL